jgi:hypothetical protein
MVNSIIENSGLLITRTLHHHKHQLRDFFNRHNCCYQAWVLKKTVNRTAFICEHAVTDFFISVRLSGGRQNRCCRLAEEPH